MIILFYLAHIVTAESFEAFKVTTRIDTTYLIHRKYNLLSVPNILLLLDTLNPLKTNTKF